MRMTSRRWCLGFSIVTLPVALLGLWASNLLGGPEYKNGIVWEEPKVVTPGQNGGPPSDAIVLFDGKDLSQWNGGDGWEIADGVASPKKGEITTKQSFGDMQLHLEFATPEKVSGSGQGRGNSGVYIMGKYEVQILDSYNNPTYFDGQCASVYKQSPPLVNACKKPGEWQTYDIIFRAPKFDQEGKVLVPAAATVLHNGVLVQNHFELIGGTYFDQPAKYTKHAEKAPFRLQNHGNPVKFRNIWVREIVPLKKTLPSEKPADKKPSTENPAGAKPAAKQPAEKPAAATEMPKTE